MRENYSKDYTGEFVVLKTIIRKGKKEQVREWLPSPITNQHISDRAAVILGEPSGKYFSLKNIQKHRGGHLGRQKLQTFGTESTWNQIDMDFAACFDPNILDEMIATAYSTRTIVYSGTRRCISRPGHFYLLPYNPRLSDVAAAFYLAAFSEHKEVFVIGLDKQALDAKTINQINRVIKTYKKTKFVFVVKHGDLLESKWRKNKNVSTVNERQFVTHCDL